MSARPPELLAAVERGELTPDQARNRRRSTQPPKTTHGAATLRAGVVARPLVRDVDLAVRLGYPRPRKIRELIRRMGQKLGRVVVRTRTGRTSMPRGGERPESVNEYWLDESQALVLALASKAPGALAFTSSAFAELSTAFDRLDAASTHQRPSKRADCEGTARPCPFRGLHLPPGL